MSNSRVRQTLVRTTLVIGLSAGLAATLQGCVLAVAGAAAGGGALVATDRRTLGAQTEDREIQVKALTQMNNGLPDGSHVNVTVFNRRVLLTGEVPSDAAKQRAEEIVRGINNVNAIVNELAVGPASSLSDRANDSYLEGRVKTSMIAEKGISANNYKVVCERGNVRVARFLRGRDAHLPLAVVAEARGLQDAGQHRGEIRIGERRELRGRLDHDVRRDRHARRRDETLLGDPVLRDRDAAAGGRDERRLREEIEARGGHVLELGRYRVAQLRELGERGLVVVCGAQMLVRDGARRARRIGIEHGDAVAHRLRGEAEHAAELAAADHAEPGARQDRGIRVGECSHV